MRHFSETWVEFKAQLQERQAARAANGTPPALPVELPLTCATCGDLGWTTPDVPPGDSRFGQRVPCECQREAIHRNAVRVRKAHSGIPQPMLEAMTFRTFRQDWHPHADAPAVRHAVKAAWNYSQNLEGWLVLCGDTGRGKSHLGVAIAVECLERAEAVTWVFLPRLFDDLRDLYASGDAQAATDRYAAVRDAPLLVVDDLGAEKNTDWTREKLHLLFVHRHNHRLPTVVTTNVDVPRQQGPIGSRLRDRRLSQVIRVEGPDYRPGVMGR